MEPSKNARLSHGRPQGSTTEENSLVHWQGKRQRSVPRNKSNCPCGKQRWQMAQAVMDKLAPRSPAEAATGGPPGPGADAERR